MKMGKMFVLPEELVEYFTECANCEDIEAVLVLRREGKPVDKGPDERVGCIDLYHVDKFKQKDRPLFAHVEDNGQSARKPCTEIASKNKDTMVRFTSAKNKKPEQPAQRRELAVQGGVPAAVSVQIPATAADSGELVYAPLKNCYWLRIAGFTVSC